MPESRTINSTLLASLLDMRKTSAEKNKAYKPNAFVFGDETGAQVKSVKTAWENCRRKAHGYEVERTENGKLTAECRANLKVINLRFHDWRRTAGSRFLAGGMSAHYVQSFLDHANRSTTSRYLKIDQKGMHAALKTFEKGRDGKDTQTDTQTANAIPSTQTADVPKLLQ